LAKCGQAIWQLCVESVGDKDFHVSSFYSGARRWANGFDGFIGSIAAGKN
jgi:hypothetical protein